MGLSWWDWWQTSRFKKWIGRILGIILGGAILYLICLVYKGGPTPFSLLILIVIVVFLLLFPEIQYFKVGPFELAKELRYFSPQPKSFYVSMIANAEETRKVYPIEEVIAYMQEGWDASVHVVCFNDTLWLKLQSEGTAVGEPLLFDGYAEVYLEKDNRTLSGYISKYPFWVWLYKYGTDVELRGSITDDTGKFTSLFFIPREPGYYKFVIKSGYDWFPCDNEIPLYFYVSEKDSDDDGVAIAGLLAVADLLRRKTWKKR